MSTILKASVPAEQFPLAETFETLPDVEVDVVRLVPRGRERIVPLLWTSGVETDSARETLAEDDSTANVQLVSQRTHDSLFQMHWTEQVRLLTHVLVEEDGAILSMRGTSTEWTVRILFPERDAISATYDACDEYDIDIRQICPLEAEATSDSTRLTDEQFATVRTALDNGYYAVPQETKLEELASELDVSHQALSERLRRGHRTLIETVIGP